MKPYFQEDGITIYHGDCREYFEQQVRARAYLAEVRAASKKPSTNDVMSLLGLADWEAEVNEFDLCLTDPPYGIQMSKGFKGAGRFAGKGSPIQRRSYVDTWDMDRPEAEVFASMLQMAKVSIIWGGNFFADILPRSTHWLSWDKVNTVPTFSDCELAWTNIKRSSVKKLTVEWNGVMGRERFRDHPTQKPEELMRMCLLHVDVSSVFDPFLGSGTTLVAAKNLGMTGVGIEREEKYCEIAAKRLSQKVFHFESGEEARLLLAQSAPTQVALDFTVEGV